MVRTENIPASENEQGRIPTDAAERAQHLATLHTPDITEKKFDAAFSTSEKQLDEKKDSWRTKLKSMFSKGLDYAVEKSVKFRDEGFAPRDVYESGKNFIQSLPDRAKHVEENGFNIDGTKLYDLAKKGEWAINNPKEFFNKANETIATGLYTHVGEGGYEAVNNVRDFILEKIAAFKEKKEESRKNIEVSRGELNYDVESLKREKTRPALNKAKSAVLNQYKKVMSWADNAHAVIMYDNKEIRSWYRQSIQEHQMQALADRYKKAAAEGHQSHTADKKIGEKNDFLKEFLKRMDNAAHGSHDQHEALHGGH